MEGRQCGHTCHGLIATDEANNEYKSEPSADVEN
jgi:hypothetical protein